ncbi:ABC transporter ATP-binding protein [Sphaerisporangium krabiense]|uniref:ABC-2 type transport system ATP-binding protein n=1 Tax=Sphaerisporangium krabiense TaxID=763782 RepID=A0A7W8Z7K8_9ACTN|nr:ATP-binding cassette domain-containing protein [Sphaerisporangium krabiense]MBB5628834.1 ABC-2 type transport system ATP-binding protein [Sphaerisporangium krabiense]
MIRARGLRRTFATKTATIDAVQGVDLDVSPGEIVGFLGPNGAGKTTTMRMLTTLLRPTGGTATVAGHDLLTEPAEVRRRIGYVPQGGAIGPGGLLGEELELQARLYGMGRAEARARASAALAEFGLDGMAGRPAGSLSGGERRRADIAMGLVHEPALLFLDEPSTGLDPRARAGLWEHIRRSRSEAGLTVFLSTHYLDEADALCDRVLIMNAGRVAGEGAPADLKSRIGPAATLDDVFLTLTGRPLKETPAA